MFKVSVSIYCIVSSHLFVLLRKILAPRCSCIQTKTCLSTVIILTNVNQIQNYICLFGLGKTETENLVTHFHLKKVLFLNIIIWQGENKLYLQYYMLRLSKSETILYLRYVGCMKNLTKFKWCPKLPNGHI